MNIQNRADKYSDAAPFKFCYKLIGKFRSVTIFFSCSWWGFFVLHQDIVYCVPHYNRLFILAGGWESGNLSLYIWITVELASVCHAAAELSLLVINAYR